MSCSTLILIHVAFLKLFQYFKIAHLFPSSLAACISLLFAYILTTKKSTKTSPLYTFLSPGSKILSSWLPLFFVPALITLPLSNLPASSDLYRLIVLLPVGFVSSLLFTVFSIRIVSSDKKEDATVEEVKIVEEIPQIQTELHSKSQFNYLNRSLKLNLLISFLLKYTRNQQHPFLLKMYLLLATLTSYTWSQRRGEKIKSFVHPLILTGLGTNLGVWGWSKVRDDVWPQTCVFLNLFLTRLNSLLQERHTNQFYSPTHPVFSPPAAS